jgi:hypothetical protein
MEGRGAGLRTISANTPNTLTTAISPFPLPSSLFSYQQAVDRQSTRPLPRSLPSLAAVCLYRGPEITDREHLDSIVAGSLSTPQSQFRLPYFVSWIYSISAPASVTSSANRAEKVASAIVFAAAPASPSCTPVEPASDCLAVAPSNARHPFQP